MVMTFVFFSFIVNQEKFLIVLRALSNLSNFTVVRLNFIKRTIVVMPCQTFLIPFLLIYKTKT